MTRKEISTLIIEDEDILIRVYEKWLKVADLIKYKLAKSEIEGYDLVKSNKFDLIISDTMDSFNCPYGPRIVEKAKSLGQNPVVIALSGSEENLGLWDRIAPNYRFEKSEFTPRKLIEIIEKEFPK